MSNKNLTRNAHIVSQAVRKAKSWTSTKTPFLRYRKRTTGNWNQHPPNTRLRKHIASISQAYRKYFASLSKHFCLPTPCQPLANSLRNPSETLNRGSRCDALPRQVELPAGSWQRSTRKILLTYCDSITFFFWLCQLARSYSWQNPKKYTLSRFCPDSKTKISNLLA